MGWVIIPAITKTNSSGQADWMCCVTDPTIPQRSRAEQKKQLGAGQGGCGA